jgi:hypothetical protein
MCLFFIVWDTGPNRVLSRKGHTWILILYIGLVGTVDLSLRFPLFGLCYILWAAGQIYESCRHCSSSPRSLSALQQVATHRASYDETYPFGFIGSKLSLGDKGGRTLHNFLLKARKAPHSIVPAIHASTYKVFIALPSFRNDPRFSLNLVPRPCNPWWYDTDDCSWQNEAEINGSVQSRQSSDYLAIQFMCLQE